MTACEGCPNQGQVCWGDGDDNADLLIVGEGPAWQEAKQGRPFVGRSGQLLNAVLAEHGMERSQVYVDNVTGCLWTSDDGKPAPPPRKAVEACSERFRSSVRAVQPKIILALGTTAAQKVLNTKAKIGEIAGAIEYSEEFESFCVPTYHPAAILRGSENYFNSLYTSTKRAVDFATGKVSLPNKNYGVEWSYIDDPGESSAVLERILYQSRRENIIIGIDTESISPHKQPRPLENQWIMVQVYSPFLGKAYSLNVLTMGEGNKRLLATLLDSPRITFIMHNLSYDQKVFYYNLGVTARNALDTMVLGLGLSERGEEVGLKALSRQYLNAPFYEKDLQVSFKVGPKNEEEWLSLAKYGSFDAYNTYELGRILPPLVREEGTMQLCKDLLLPAQECFATIPGTRIDLDYVKTLEAEWVPLIEKAERNLQDWAKTQGFPLDLSVVSNQKIAIPCPQCVPTNIDEWEPIEPRKQWRGQLKQIIGDPSCKRCMKRRYVFEPDTKLNVRSNKQVQHLAFEILRMTNPEGRSCDKYFMEYNRGTELVRRIEDFRKKDFLLSHYVRGIAEHVWSDGKVHPDILLFGTRTGRLAIQNPAVQTLPKWNVDADLARSIRRIFIPSDGYMLVECDYKNLEVFMFHHYCKDKNLLDALINYDFHRKTASAIFNKPYNEVTPRERQSAKPVNFGVIFGRTAHALAKGELAEITKGDERIAQHFIDSFWQEYKDGYKQYKEWQRQAVKEGEIVSVFGRKRRWRLITPDNIEGVKNEGSNHPVQSAASDLCLSSFITLNKILPERGLGNVLFPVHDAIIAEIKEDRLEEGIKIMQDVMTTPPFETDTPFFVDTEYGYNLGEMKKYQ